MLGKMAGKAPSVLARVISRVASNVRKNLSKETIKKYSVKSSDVKATVSYKKPSVSNLDSYVKTSGKTIPLYKFKIKPKNYTSTLGKKISKRPTVKAKVMKSSSFKTIGTAFIAKMKNGHIGVFKRDEEDKIKELHTLSIPQMVANKEVMDFIYKDAAVTYNKRITHEINRILSE